MESKKDVIATEIADKQDAGSAARYRAYAQGMKELLEKAQSQDKTEGGTNA